MIKKKGDVFDTTACAIGHGVNLQGVMGAGIAKTFKSKYPVMYEQYVQRCDDYTLEPGNVFIWRAPDHFVYNMATQIMPGANASLRLVRYAAFHAAIHALGAGIDRIAIPMIGCGIGGLEWDDVEQELLGIEALTGVEFEVWEYQP